MADNPPVLGKVLTGSEHRDAIHVAVCPVIATERLTPGEHVGFVKAKDVENVGRSVKPIGIIDPYLSGPVFKGERCWLFLYPNTITTLRHEWTHPAFVQNDPKQSTRNDQSHYDWLIEFADAAELGYDELIEAAHDYIEHGVFLCDDGKWEGFNTPVEFWDHFEIVTGRKVSQTDRGNFFTCSC